MQQDLNKLFSDSAERTYSEGQILLYQEEKTDNVYRVVSGYIKMYDITASGEEKLYLILGPGDIFPLIWTFDKTTTLRYFYEAINEITVQVTDRKAVIATVKDDHSTTLNMMKYFVNRTNDLMSRVACIESSNAGHKVGQVLLYLAESHGDEVARKAYSVRIPVTHQMIADMSGLNRSTASIEMKKLEKQKIFKNTKNGGYIIHTDRLESLLET